jgi:hypothetical protein
VVPSAETARASDWNPFEGKGRNKKLAGTVVVLNWNACGIRDDWVGIARPAITAPLAEIPYASLSLCELSFVKIGVPRSWTPIELVQMNARLKEFKS